MNEIADRKQHDALLVEALTGQRAAWDALVKRHTRIVELSLIGKGIRVDWAREATQEAWIKLMDKQREGHLQQLQLPGLAMAQAWYIVMERIRQERRAATRTEGEAVAETLPDGSPTAEEQLLSREQLVQAKNVLAGLPPSAQHVFRMAYERGGTSHKEIAGELRVSVQYVRQTLCNARKALRLAFEVDV